MSVSLPDGYTFLVSSCSRVLHIGFNLTALPYIHHHHYIVHVGSLILRHTFFWPQKFLLEIYMEVIDPIILVSCAPAKEMLCG